ncbi:DMT family transporter [Polycladidibacter stylochi]|uniref:DMT family transporter n=1 Tax=Polycladidibacter stylochi TaxID=1807766 RepID=UPI00082E3E5E|nr:DMT family transporter [Pseudovibrio stylochi]
MSEDKCGVETSTNTATYLPQKLIGYWQQMPGNSKGIAWALLATFIFACVSATIKLLGDGMHVTQILMLRQAFMFLISLPVIIRSYPQSLTTKAPLLHLSRTVLASLTMLLGFTAIIHLPLADSTVIGFARTFFLTIFAILFLGERVGIHRWAATILGFIGVLIIVEGAGQEGLNIYSLMALTGAALAAMVGIILRKVSQVDLPITILTFQAVSVGLVMAPFAIYNWQPLTMHSALLILALGSFSWMAQMCNIQAMRNGEATAIAPFDYTRLIYATIISILLFSVWPTMNTYVGAFIIVAASLYTMRREAILGKKVASCTKTKTDAP